MTQEQLQTIRHTGHAGILISCELVIYIDPYNLRGNPHNADIILCTHSHYDHLSPEDIAKAAKPGTVLVVPERDIAQAKETGIQEIVSVVPGKEYSIKEHTVRTVPAYNIGKQFHPKGNGWVGYILTIGGFTLYHAGDTDATEELKAVKAGIMCVPVGGTYTMNWKEAAEAVNTAMPDVASPIHFGDIVGSASDASNFVQHLSPKIHGLILPLKH